jgi:hypothetical protein
MQARLSLPLISPFAALSEAFANVTRSPTPRKKFFGADALMFLGSAGC